MGKKGELLLRGVIDRRDGREIEIRTQGSDGTYKSYCYILQKGESYGAIELESYADEMDARAGHLKWLRKRERCLAYLEALGVIRRTRRLWGD